MLGAKLDQHDRRLDALVASVAALVFLVACGGVDELPTTPAGTPAPLATCQATTDRLTPPPQQSKASKILVAESVASYALAYTPSRHVFETDDGSLYIFFFDGDHVIARVADPNGKLGPSSLVSHVPVAQVFSAVMVGERFYVAYTDRNQMNLYLRSIRWLDETTVLDEPLTLRSDVRSFSLQGPSLGVAPDSGLWVIYRDNPGPEKLIVFAIRALGGDERSWGEPEQISTGAHVADSFYGTSGAVFWPGGEPLIVHSGESALNAAVLTDGRWNHAVIDDEYTGVHDFAGVVDAQGVLHLVYMVGCSDLEEVLATFKFDGCEARWIRYDADSRWSDAVSIGPAAIHSLSIGIVGGIPVVFAYDGKEALWYAPVTTIERVEIAHFVEKEILYTWTAVPAESDGIVAAWVEGERPPWLKGQDVRHSVYLKKMEHVAAR